MIELLQDIWLDGISEMQQNHPPIAFSKVVDSDSDSLYATALVWSCS